MHYLRANITLTHKGPGPGPEPLWLGDSNRRSVSRLGKGAARGEKDGTKSRKSDLYGR